MKKPLKPQPTFEIGEEVTCDTYGKGTVTGFDPGSWFFRYNVEFASGAKALKAPWQLNKI